MTKFNKKQIPEFDVAAKETSHNLLSESNKNIGQYFNTTPTAIFIF